MKYKAQFKHMLSVFLLRHTIETGRGGMRVAPHAPSRQTSPGGAHAPETALVSVPKLEPPCLIVFSGSKNDSALNFMMILFKLFLSPNLRAKLLFSRPNY